MLRSDEAFIFYSALVDSGADYCIFSIEIAKALRIKLSKDTARFRGISKGNIRGHWGEIEARVGDMDFSLKAIFADISGFGHGIVGQNGFFDIFIVKFDLVKEEVELMERKYQ